jgi:signal transduction histidine kinase
MTAKRKLAFGAIYLGLYLTAHLASLPHQTGAALTLPWNAAPAFSFAFVARFGSRWLPLVLIAPLLAGALEGTIAGFAVDALLQALAETAMALFVLRFHRKPQGALHGLDSLRGVFLFLAVAAGAAAMAAAIRAGGDVMGESATLWSLPSLALHHFLSYTVAILSVAPLILVHNFPKRIAAIRLPLTGEIVLQLGALALIAWEVFGRFVNAEIHFFYLLFLPFAWIATRHGQTGASLALGAIFSAPVLTDLLFGHNDRMIVELQIRLGVLAVTSLLFGAMVDERRRQESLMAARQLELAHFQRLNVGWEMASALAHELNQPLTAAMNLSQAALRFLTAPSPDLDKTASTLRMSIDRIERVGQIIHGLRDFMRKGELTLTRILPADMTTDALQLVQGEAKAAGISLQTAGLYALPPVLADKTQIVQVLVNLLRNAVQALSQAKTPEPTIAVSGRLVQEGVEMTVSDNGPGLTPDVQDRLFEPFVTTKASGMGLGLSISKTILEAHEGRLWAERAPQGGAVFRFTLPLAQRDGKSEE